jgi:PAS domain S-box-containing protein
MWLSGTRGDVLFRSRLARYAFGLAMVVAAFALRVLLSPLTGTGAPFVLFFGATLVTSLLAGVGPAILTLALSLPLAVTAFVIPAGYSVSQAGFQSLLYGLDGSLVIYLTILAARRRRHMRETIDLSPDAYFLSDLGGRFNDVNEAACRLLGYERAELVAKTILDIIPAEDADRLETVRAELLTPGSVHKADWRLRRKDGSVVPVEVSANILRDGRWQAFIRDITQARQIATERERLLRQERRAREAAEAANAMLRESEERFRLAIDSAPIGMALVALDGRFIRVNQVLCELTGYSAEELTRLTFPQVTHPDDVRIDLEQLRALRAGKIPRYQLEKRYIRKDGSVVHIMLSRSVLRDPRGAALYYVTQMEDISARKRAEKALRISEAQFSGIVSIAADAIISVDNDQRITIFNEGAQKIFGYTKDEVIGTALERLIPERFRAVHREHFARFAAGRQYARSMEVRREIFALRKNGEEFPAEASVAKVDLGESTIFSVVLRDITYRKSVEEKLERALAARDDVLRIVAHDLRNPLSTITMQASLLERQEPEPERRDQTPRLVITRSSQRMTSLIQDLLDVALVEAGQLKIERERLSASDLVREAVDAQALLASAEGLDVRVESGRDLPLVWGDHKRLLQVFENLIGNAIKFTPRGGRITLTAAPADGAVRFAVADTGAGIAPESVPHVFDRFWQATTRKRSLGAGLGLPITKGIVEAHGGRIWLESAVGRGCTFFFTIPSAPTEAGAPSDSEVELRRQSSPPRNLGRSRRQRA